MAGAANVRRASETTGLSPTRPVRDASDLGDRRRWASFLTWAFVLAEMAGRDGILPASAHAGDEALGRTDHASSATAPIANNLPNISVSTATEAPELITYQHAPTLPAYAATPLSSELGEAKIAPIADGFAHGGGAVGGGGFGHPMSADDASLASEASDGAFVAFNPSGELLDLGLSLDMNDTAQGLLGGVSDVLSSLPLIGSLLGNLGDTLASSLPALSPATSLIGLDGGHDDAQGAGVGSPGQINFSFGAPSDSPALVSDSGGYTNYGIALSFGGSDAGASPSEGSADSDLTSGLDAWALNHLAGIDHSTSDALHIDQAVMRTASDILA